LIFSNPEVSVARILLRVHMSSRPSNNRMVNLVRLSAADLQNLHIEGSLTSIELAKLSLQQIEKYDKKAHSSVL
jgi:hypothetical protein